MSPQGANEWKVTDGEESVPVHAAAPVSHPVRSLNAGTLEFEHRSLALPAMIGVVLVLFLIGWYIGLGELLKGQLVGDEENTIRITEDGMFEPSHLDLTTGETVTIVNENADPQVLKSQNGRELFTTQVLFDEPFTFTVSDTAVGPYSYISETLPEDRMLTFTVSMPIEQAAQEEEVPSDELPIPIPFELDPSPVPEEPQARNDEPVVTTHESGPATITLGGPESSSSASSRPSGSAKLPTNPYTVHATGADQYVTQTQAVEEASEELHSGAPLQQYAQYRPPATTGTGPEHTAILVLLVSGLLFAPLARKMM